MFDTETRTVTALALVETLETVNKHSQGFLFEKKKADKKYNEREQKHFIVLYIWKYMSEYWKKKNVYVN